MQCKVHVLTVSFPSIASSYLTLLPSLTHKHTYFSLVLFSQQSLQSSYQGISLSYKKGHYSCLFYILWTYTPQGVRHTLHHDIRTCCQVALKLLTRYLNRTKICYIGEKYIFFGVCPQHKGTKVNIQAFSRLPVWFSSFYSTGVFCVFHAFCILSHILGIFFFLLTLAGSRDGKV